MGGTCCSAFVPMRKSLTAQLSTSSFGSTRTVSSARSLVLFYQNSTSPIRNDEAQVANVLERFKREAAKKTEIDEECILTIDENRYNMTAWANAHPGKKQKPRLQ